jgi:hypothetical protein
MSATAVRETRSDVVQPSRSAGMKPFFAWVGLCLLGIPLAGYLGNIVAGPVDGVAPALLAGALTGAGIGLAQWFTLRRSLGVSPGWIAATSIGLAVGLAVGASVVGYETGRPQLVIMGAISGAFVGLAQGFLLRRHGFSLWPMWMVAHPPAWALGWFVSSYVIARNIDERFPVFGASGVVVFAIISGLLLMAGLRRATSTSG